ncbi:hypothetical protein EI613_17220 [Azospirillum sp. 412522]|nr:hypothetical protein [Azospirillum sp. 412522]MBY6263641.1 hypothetical protein [Azospirillum sp. 412522]
MVKPPVSGLHSFQYRTSRTDPPGGRSRGSRYKLLFSVAYHHDFYGALDPGTGGNGGNCPDLQAFPTPDSLQLMSRLGLLMKSGRTGFQIYFDIAQTEAIVAYLRQQYVPKRGQDGALGCWTRLTFLLRATNPDFVGFSDLPIGTNPMEFNLYACNSQAHADGTVIRLCQGDRLERSDLHPVVGSEIALPVRGDVRRVTVTDLAGRIVQRYRVPRTVPADTTLHIDLRNEPLDLYTVTIDRRQESAISRPVIYTTGSPAPLCLIDVLLTKPRPRMSGGVYPVPPVFGDGVITPAQMGDIAYTLPFGARSTQWRYYVASQKAGGGFRGLRIDGPGADFHQSSDPVQLPDGTPAVLLTSQAPLPMRRIPPQRFRLTGQRLNPDGSQTDIRVDCLPAAPQSPVWPDENPDHGVSEMYVYT